MKDDRRDRGLGIGDWRRRPPGRIGGRHSIVDLWALTIAGPTTTAYVSPSPSTSDAVTVTATGVSSSVLTAWSAGKFGGVDVAKAVKESGIEERIDQAFLDGVSAKLGKGNGLKLSAERRRIRGGFILRSGRIETNCALETIVRDARERLETEVAAELFGEKAIG